jgi:hypothetical protein
MSRPGYIRPFSEGFNLASTVRTTIYTSHDGPNTLVMVRAANKTPAPVAITVEWYKASTGITAALIYGYQIIGNGSINIEEATGIALRDGDLIYATAGTANALDVIVSVEEIAGRSS